MKSVFYKSRGVAPFSAGGTNRSAESWNTRSLCNSNAKATRDFSRVPNLSFSASKVFSITMPPVSKPLQVVPMSTGLPASLRMLQVSWRVWYSCGLSWSKKQCAVSFKDCSGFLPFSHCSSGGILGRHVLIYLYICIYIYIYIYVYRHRWAYIYIFFYFLMNTVYTFGHRVLARQQRWKSTCYFSIFCIYKGNTYKCIYILPPHSVRRKEISAKIRDDWLELTGVHSSHFWA